MIRISIIIPCQYISDSLISKTLPSFCQQSSLFEVIVLPDYPCTKKILCQKYPWLKIIPTKKSMSPAQKRNIGVSHTLGDWIAFIDDDVVVREKWVDTIWKIVTSHKNGVYCGPGILPPDSSWMQKLFDIILTSSIGSGTLTYRFKRDHRRLVDDFPAMNFIIKRSLFLAVGGFQTQYWPGEDSKLCNQLVNVFDQKILYHPHLAVYHYRRNSIRNFLSQHARYGYHRGRFWADGDKNSQKIYYVLPSLVSIYSVISFIIFIFYTKQTTLYQLSLFIFPLIYFVTILIVLQRQTKNWVEAYISSMILILTHIVYGYSFIFGFMHSMLILFTRLARFQFIDTCETSS